ncbi:hypothetical protein WDU94_001945 [Cyamophila willieti]
MPLTSFLLIMGVGTLATTLAAGYARRGGTKKKGNTSGCGDQPTPGPPPCECPQCVNDRRPIQIILERSNPGHHCQKGILKKSKNCKNHYRTYSAYQEFIRQSACQPQNKDNVKNVYGCPC